MMSHEIRTPLHGLMATIDMLRDEPLSAAAAHETLEILQREPSDGLFSRRLHTLIGRRSSSAGWDALVR
jgi:signal transduction histidine kinase